ncbi:alpha/beta fold hydrolase [Lysinibacillus sp. BPa_S21]|uniref:alpha/beta fold hydrolase n=1 Tax=Lysinibacillus sp. BPa_S21 TaxID=2932478 RepID=UPI002011D3AA|nr:alpha/beta hydrolase [Lysinibacillus sp. BPa_S21]MCL1694657.1 alpha/beta hydrolase [Lysinibacillus sp. BPa_S21]
MKKIFKKIVIYFIAVILIGLVAIFSYHRYQLSKESKHLDTNGTLVEVDHQKINVYTEGDGQDTYVFMAGSGVAAPIYEMKGLYSQFSQGHKIVVVERAGYGYSDVSKDERDMDTVLAQTREALLKSGNKPPYILVPHSISGVEAIYWAQKYPKEIKGIIALDIGLPSQYAEHKMGAVDLWTVKGMNLLTKLGVHRLAPSKVYNQQVIKQSFLSEKEKEIYKALSYKQIFNDDMKNELLQVYENSIKSEELPKPKDTPILLIDAIAEQNKDSKFTKYHSQKYAEFAEQINIADVKELSGTHSIYLYKPEEIYRLAIDFMKTKVDNKERSRE